MRFQNNTIHREIDQAIELAEDLLNMGSNLSTSLAVKNTWKYDNIKMGITVVENLIIVKRKPIQVLTYKPRIPWSMAIGGFKNGHIQINIKKLPYMTTVEIAANLLHEYAHYCGYSHGNNFKTKEKVQFSVPYFLSENVSKWI